MKRFAFAAALAAGIGFAQAQTTTVEQPDAFGLDQITAFTTQEMVLPASAGEPFRAMVDLGGQMVVLDLVPHSVRSANFTVMINDETGRHAMANVPAPATYLGEISGWAGSSVAASLVDGQLTATIDLEQGWYWVVEPMTKYVPDADPTDHVVYRSFEVDEKDNLCGVADDAVVGKNDMAAATWSPEVPKILDLALDNDFEYFQQMGQSTSRMIQDMEQTISRVSFIYNRDVEVTIEIVHMELRTTSNDPYTTSDAGALLNQFTSFWANNMGSIRRDLAELFSGRNFNGGTIGIAWLNGVCSNTQGYSVIQTFGLSLTTRVAVSAHELGHNFAAVHCSGSDCRIMCPGIGGCSGDISRFGQASKNTIRSTASRSRCMTSPPPPAIALPFTEPFPTTSFTPNMWDVTTGTVIGSLGINPPSAPLTAVMNQVATLETIDVLVPTTLFPTPVFVSYWTQHRAVETGETLVIEHRDGTGTWRISDTIVSDGSNPLGFLPGEFKLDAGAYSNAFRLRIRALGNDGNDLWMVDDVSISTRCLADVTGDGTLDIFDFLAFQNLFVTSSPRADLTGDGTHDIFDFLAFQNMFVAGCY
jgi:Metallo-peptidase family M12B Reprolysin-like